MKWSHWSFCRKMAECKAALSGREVCEGMYLHNELWKIYLYANHNLAYMFHVFFENISMSNYILRNILTTKGCHPVRKVQFF